MTKTNNPVTAAQSVGQSIWYDNIRRAMLTSGELQRLIDKGVVGVTSNPTIFERAIAGSQDYDESLIALANHELSPEEIFETLAVKDIQAAADLFLPVYEQTGGLDGYVSLEVRPTLAHDLDGTIEEAQRLYAALDCPNVMIKVPATPEGIRAVEVLTENGININVTLIFAVPQYEAVANAYISGLEKRAAAGHPIDNIASVASFFISRIDTAIDNQLESIGNQDLAGKIAIANAKVAYAKFNELFNTNRWARLAKMGAGVQRPLWASTGTKNPSYSDTKYVDSLVGPHTVNTVPPATLQSFIDHGRVKPALEDDIHQAAADIAKLKDLKIDLNDVTDKLLSDGLKGFTKSYTDLLESIEDKLARLRKGDTNFRANLGPYQQQVDAAVENLKNERILPRIWEYDFTVWSSEPDEITNRLGWLHSPEQMQAAIPKLQTLTRELQDEGFTHALLMGMGGSSLAPETFSKTFGTRDGFLELGVLDSTDPAAVRNWEKHLDPTSTVFIVSTKSGGTVETLSFFKYFYNLVLKNGGKDQAGKHFIAITDPGSKLADLAEEYGFRSIFLNDPNIGGRYSALSYFGLVPAALMGVDLNILLDRAQVAASNCDGSNCPKEGDNFGGVLGTILGELAKAGRDKLTLVTSTAVASFGDWVEQLIAESTGKNGKGIVPVVGEPLGEPEVYRQDRLFVHLRLAADTTGNQALTSLEQAGHPVIRIDLKDRYDLGAQFFLWEMATAVAGYHLGIHPFNQPDVENAKILAREMVEEYQSQGALPFQKPNYQDGIISVYYDDKADIEMQGNAGESFDSFLLLSEPGDYVALQAYLPPTSEIDEWLGSLRRFIRDKTRLATTVGYGPRFLHSTGQLHKGDAGNGLFIQFTSEADEDLAIPEVGGSDASNISFGVLKLAQALGDRQALLEKNRGVIRFHLAKDPQAGLKQLMEQIL